MKICPIWSTATKSRTGCSAECIFHYFVYSERLNIQRGNFDSTRNNRCKLVDKEKP